MKDQYTWGFFDPDRPRASVEMNTRPMKAPRKIGRPDLLIPLGPGKPRMLALTMLLGAVMTVIYVFPPVLIIGILTSAGVSSTWVWATLAVAWIVLWSGLFYAAVREDEADRRYAAELLG